MACTTKYSIYFSFYILLPTSEVFQILNTEIRKENGFFFEKCSHVVKINDDFDDLDKKWHNIVIVTQKKDFPKMGDNSH